MAKPRVFISSTFYDLKHVRADLERFIRELGYEPIRNETGTIPYGKDKPLETYAYEELDLCDIIVAIIGGRYGTESKEEEGYSISQVELRRAVERGIQVFIFVERDVLSEFSTYRINKSVPDVKYRFVDDIRVYEFIEDLHKLPKNNPISGFETSSDILRYLRAQWAGLFQRFLQDQKREAEIKVLDEMKSIAGTLEQMVNFLSEERRSKDDAIQHILLANHPIFRRLADVTKTPYRIFFTDVSELKAWLSARGWEVNIFDEFEWENTKLQPGAKLQLNISEELFDESGKLRVMTETEWKDEWVTVKDLEKKDEFSFEPDDDLPF